MNAGRSSDSQAQPTACLLANRTVSPFWSQWPENSRPLFPHRENSPGYSGGAVPESHRSSLFAGRSQLQTIGHQIRWRSVSVVPPLSSCAGRPTITGTAFHAAGAGVKPCRLRRQTASICSGSTALRRTGCTRGAHGILCPQHATSRVSKNTWVSLKPLSPARR